MTKVLVLLGVLLSGALTLKAQVWHPDLNTSWQWQLTTPIDQTVDAVMYDIDLFDNDASVIDSLHAAGRIVICYVDVGSWENWRPDADQFPKSVLGAVYKGYPDERWLDIRALDVLAPIMQARLDLAAAKGCDGVEPDNADGYDTSSHQYSGFPLTYEDQIVYNTFIANEAHARRLSVGLKNDLAQIRDLVAVFDWAMNEQCFQYRECDNLLAFLDAGKPVFQVEYSLNTSRFCPQANALNFNSMRKHPRLDAYREPCR
jgi:hypothetical protein